MRADERTIVVSGYPLSKDTRGSLAKLAGNSIEYLCLSELRLLRKREMMRRVRGVGIKRLIIAIDSSSVAPLLPLLRSIVSISSSVPLLIWNGGRKIRRFPRLLGMMGSLRIIAASLHCRRVVKIAERQVRALGDLPRLIPPASENKSILYLKTNLMLGVKAGGSVGHVAGVINEFLHRNSRVTFVGGEAPPCVESDAVVHLVPPPDTFGIPPDSNHYRFHFYCVEEGLKAASKQNMDVIYQRMSLGNYAGVTLSRKLRIPYILEYNGSEAWISKNWGAKVGHAALAEAVEEICLRHAHLVVTISDVLREELLQRGVREERIVVYPNGIDPTVYNPENWVEAGLRVRSGFGWNEDNVIIGFVGTFGAWHGAEILGQAIREWHECDPEGLRRSGVRFLFVGDGIKLPDVRRELDGRVPQGLVSFAGLVPQDKAPAYLSACDVLVSPHVGNADGSRFFGSPTKLFEYMAMAKPIVASDLEQIGVVLRPAIDSRGKPVHNCISSDGARAILTQPGSSADLVAGMQLLIERHGLREQLGSEARRSALAQYTWKHHVEAIIRGLSTALSIRD